MSDTLTLGGVAIQLPLTVEPRDTYAACVLDGHDLSVCVVDYAYCNSAADNARLARLFAADPDLLIAAEAVVADAGTSDAIVGLIAVRADLVDALHAAIAKARGGS